MGHTGSAVRGRFLDFMPVSPEDFVAASNYVYSEVCFSQLLVSIQRILGFEEERFGYVGDEIPAGGLPGL
jgi:hypothetical protein